MTKPAPEIAARRRLESRPPRPTVFLVGAPKAGSSALANFLAQHPEVSVAQVKETNYLCSDLDLPRPRSEEEYLSLFETSERTRVLLDASILSMYSRTAAAAIARYAPEARILAVLRDPVEAMRSWHGQLVFTGNEPLRRFEEAVAAEADRKGGRRLPRVGTTARCPSLLYYREVMRYAEQIERYLHVFGPDRVYVVLYEDFRADPEGTYREVLRFVGVDPTHRPTFREVNPSRERRSWRLHEWMKRLLAPLAHAVLSPRLRLRLADLADRLNSRPAVRARPDPEVVARLRAECRTDVERLEALLGRDLSAWYAP